MVENIVIIGANGAIGNALIEEFKEKYPDAAIHAFSRQPTKSSTNLIKYHLIDYDEETSIQKAAIMASEKSPIDCIIVATGILHKENLLPEKSLKELSAEKFQRVFSINTVLPALIAKHFLPKLNKNNRSLFAVLSARVGSISDNQLGGWYAYRASKAALNMVIKNAAIEIGRYNRQAIIVGIHPGTVDSNLSKPFQTNVPTEKLFSPEFSATKILEVLDNLKPENSGKCFAWDGKEIQP